MRIDNTTKYKYLSEVVNNKLNLEEHIAQLKNKVGAAYQTILAIAEDRRSKHIKMEGIWKLVNTCITPIKFGIQHTMSTMNGIKLTFQIEIMGDAFMIFTLLSVKGVKNLIVQCSLKGGY